MREIAPVLVTGFSRPELLNSLLEFLSENIPMSKLYIAIDGRYVEESEANKKVKKCQSIGLEYESKGANYISSDKNLGCYMWNYTAINWFFSNEPAGIILEDDILPTVKFLSFATNQLKLNEKNLEIGSISGANLVPQEIFKNEHFDSRLSMYSSSWGWATWSDRWIQFVNIADEENIKAMTISRRMKYFEKKYWERIFENTYKGNVDSWAFRWLFTHFVNDWKVVTPNINLIKYLGFGEEATHTQNSKGWNWNVINGPSIDKFNPLSNSKPIINFKADLWIKKNHFRVTRNYLRDSLKTFPLTNYFLLNFDKIRDNI